jgi:hypothetical protein
VTDDGHHIHGRPAAALTAGDALLVPAVTVHAVGNPGTGKAAELATYVVEQGTPFRVVGE